MSCTHLEYLPSAVARYALRCTLSLLAIGLVSGCQQTRFEALPTGEVSDCVRDWVGAWRIEDMTERDEKDDGPVYWIVSDNCARYQTLEPDGESEDEDEYSIRYVRHGNSNFIAATARPDAEAKDSDWHKAHMLIRYEFRGHDQIRAFEVDNQRVARLIVDGEIGGRSEVKSKPGKGGKNDLESVENLLFGPSSETDSVIRRKGVFGRKPWLILHRTSSEEIARARAGVEERRSPEGG
ncbi:MAG: hypothetical protein SGI99_12125 [Pseudomonadota bacterium]|nr:hypothetical protein [Pseudomonadota bacterium]